MANVRPSIGGGWYPHDPGLLVQNVEMYLANAESARPRGTLIGLIVPHAGHMFSGHVAAYAYNCIKGMKFDTVIIVSPSHFLTSGNIITSSHDAYETPLGIVEVDKNLVNQLNHALMDNYQERLVPVSNDSEHAIEVELPFLQHILGDFRFLPIMIFSQDSRTTQVLGHSLARVTSGRNALLIASSDLSHFYPASEARKLDHEMLRRIESFDPEGVIEAESDGSGFACGKGAIASVLWACSDLGGDRVEVLSYANSGYITGDYESVVGYGAAVILQTN